MKVTIENIHMLKRISILLLFIDIGMVFYSEMIDHVSKERVTNITSIVVLKNMKSS